MVVAKSHNKKQVFSTIVVFMLLIYPVLQTYGYVHNNFAFIIMTGLSVLALFRTGIKSYMPKLLNYYFLFWGVSHVLMASSASSIIPLGVIRTYLMYNMLFKEFDYTKCLKMYNVLAVIFIVFFFFQEFVFATTGYRVLGVSQNLPLALSIDSDTYYQKMMYGDRSASFFSEPAHFVQFLLPLLAIKLFHPQKRFDYFFSVVIVIALLLLQSGNALLGLTTIVISYMWSKMHGVASIRKIIFIVLMTITISTVAVQYFNSEIGQKMIERRESLDSTGGTGTEKGTSGFLRVYRGFFVYDAMTNFEKLIGADDQNRIDNAIHSSIVAWSFDENDYYFNLVQALLIRTGIIGTIIFVVFIVGCFKRVNNCGKTILLTFVCLSFIAALHFTNTMALYMLLALSLKRDNINTTQNMTGVFSQGKILCDAKD